MSEPLEVLAMPRAPSDHPEGSTEWLIAQLNSADDIDAMVAERLRALEAEVAALNRVIAGQGAEILKLRQERADMEARAALVKP